MPLCMLFIIHHHIIFFQYFVFSCPVLIVLTVQIFSSQTWVTLTKTYIEDTSLYALHFEYLRHFIIAHKNAGECFMWNNIIKPVFLPNPPSDHVLYMYHWHLHWFVPFAYIFTEHPLHYFTASIGNSTLSFQKLSLIWRLLL